MKALLFFLLFPILVSAQNFQAHYGTVHDEDSYCMASTHDNGFILCGSSSVANGGRKDATLIKTNAGGAIQWSKEYGGPGDETAINVSALDSGGYVFCGETFSTDPAGDAFIAKTDSAGNLIWWRNYGDVGYDCGYSVSQLNDGGFIAAGLIENVPVNYDAFLMRLNSNGDTLWTKIFGGPGIDHAVRVITTSDGGFLFSGKMLTYGAGSCDVWLVKTDMNGDTLWTSQIGGAGWDEGMDVIEIANAYMVCGGTNSSGAGNYDFLLMQTDLSGNLNWAKTYGGQNVEASYSIKEVPAGGYIFAGYTETFGPGHSRGTDSANAWVIRTDLLGDTMWTMAYGGTLKEECFAVNNTNDGGFAISGYTGSFGDSLQAYLFKTDVNGYSGCNERRSAPDLGTPSLSVLHHNFNIDRGMTLTNPAITITSGGFAETANCGGPLNIIEIPEEEIIVFPNPAAGEITVQAENRITEIFITDIYGRSMSVSLLINDSKSIRLDVDELARGWYFVNVRTEGGRSLVQKVIIR